ncbi:MAG: hypothetical protein ACRDBR_02460 [Metamycoplasmataceae bacterium]
MKKLKKNKLNFLLFSALALTTGAVLTVVSCTAENVIPSGKELKINKKVNSIELSQNEFDVLKPASQNGVVTEQVKTILDKVFNGIDATNVSQISFVLNESETKIIIKPIEGYYFEGKLSSLDVLYTVKTQNINIPITIKEITDKMVEKDIQNILGDVVTDKVASLNKLFGGITKDNVNFFSIQKIDDSNNKPTNIKLNANEGYIFNNTEKSVISNKFLMDTEVTPPPVGTTELKIGKRVNTIEFSQNDFDILKGNMGSITDITKPIIDKIFTGIDSTNISKISFSLKETETMVVLTPAKGYHFEGNFSVLEVSYIIASKDKVNIAVSAKTITEKIQETDIQNILGSVESNKISSLNKLFTGIDNNNIKFFNTEKVDVGGKTTNIKLVAIQGYIFNNTAATLTSNSFTIDSGVVPPIIDKKLNVTVKKAVEGAPLTFPDLRIIYRGDSTAEEKLPILNKVFDGITLDNINYIKSDYTAAKTQIIITTKLDYTFSDGSSRLESVTFPEAQDLLIPVVPKTGNITFTDQDAEDMISKNNDVKLAALSKVFDGLNKDNIKGITEPKLGNTRNTVFIYKQPGYLFPENKHNIESNRVTGISELVYIQPVQYPSGIYKEDFTNILDPKISRQEKIHIFLKFFQPESGWVDEFDSVNIKSISNDKITLEAKKGFIFLVKGGKNVYEITSNSVTSFATAPKFLNIGLVPKTKSITSTDIADLNNPTKKLGVLNKYFTNVTAANIDHFSVSVNTPKTILSLRANTGYSLGQFIQRSTLDSWWNLPEKGTNPTTGANPVQQWMPRQQNEVEAAPNWNAENLDASNRPFKWLSSTPQRPTVFPTLNKEEQQVVDFYKDTTARITSPVWIGEDEYAESGTVWYYPKPDWDKTNDWTYFGTNIHVITNNLTKTKLNSSTQKPVHGWYLKEDQKHKDITFSFHRDKDASENSLSDLYFADVSKGEIELVDLALNTSPNYDINGKNRNMLDFAVIRVKTIGRHFNNTPFDIGKHINKNKTLNYDWIDTEAEFKEIFENIEDLTFYIGGYPDGFWTIKSYARNQFWVPQTSTLPIKSGTKWYTDPKLSDLDAVKLGGINGGEEWYSMSNSLMFPHFPIGHGGSGSLVTILHKGVVRPVGIFWGEFAGNDFSNQNLIRIAGADLFYTPNYFFKSQTESALSYNFTKVKTAK